MALRYPPLFPIQRVTRAIKSHAGQLGHCARPSLSAYMRRTSTAYHEAKPDFDKQLKAGVDRVSDKYIDQFCSNLLNELQLGFDGEVIWKAGVILQLKVPR